MFLSVNFQCEHVRRWALRCVTFLCWSWGQVINSHVIYRSPCLLSIISKCLLKKLSRLKTTGVKARLLTGPHTHTKHSVYHKLLSPERVMILLYLHGFSYIDLDQEEVPPGGAPVPRIPIQSYCVRVCMCAKHTSSLCVTKAKKEKPQTSNYVHRYAYMHARTGCDHGTHPHCWGISSSRL